jgi:hypothetical protein
VMGLSLFIVSFSLRVISCYSRNSYVCVCSSRYTATSSDGGDGSDDGDGGHIERKVVVLFLFRPSSASALAAYRGYQNPDQILI